MVHSTRYAAKSNVKNVNDQQGHTFLRFVVICSTQRPETVIKGL